MAIVAAFPSTNVDPAFGRLHKNGAGTFGASSIVVESVLVDGKAANIAMQPTPIEGPTPTEGFWYRPSVGVGHSVGVGCMAMLAAFPFTDMDSTTMEPAPKVPAPFLWRRPKAGWQGGGLVPH